MSAAPMRIVVVGAGLSGLAAARALMDDGHDVVVLDKGRSPGGRLATRRIGDATLDHGAQFFTIRSDAFAEVVQPHIDSGLVREWCRGFGTDDGYPRYMVHGGMNTLTKAQAVDLDVRTNTMVFAVRPGAATGWEVVVDDGTIERADAVVLTCPVPQSYSLLVTAGIELPVDLLRLDYDRTLAVLLVLDGPSAVPEPGARQHPTDVLSFVTDNRRKGVSATEALTIHANAAWSKEHWDDGHDTMLAALVDAAAEFVGHANVVEAQLKKWRFATPQTIWPEQCWVGETQAGMIVLAGDAFAGPKVEGAVLSGLAAADVITPAGR